MEIDLNSMSLRELRDLQARVTRAIASFEERKKKEVLAEVEELVREKGFSLAEITGMATTRKRAATRSQSAAKYINP
ncbi:MAG: transcriptional regulator, partial [Gemmobacter sp.]